MGGRVGVVGGRVGVVEGRVESTGGMTSNNCWMASLAFLLADSRTSLAGQDPGLSQLGWQELETSNWVVGPQLLRAARQRREAAGCEAFCVDADCRIVYYAASVQNCFQTACFYTKTGMQGHDRVY